jgi:4-hydroxyacetophenone monooxygenase
VREDARRSEAGFDADLLHTALRAANIPTLLMVLVHLTGDQMWLREPFCPAPIRGLGDDDTGGLPPEIRAVVREAAHHAIMAWTANPADALPALPVDLLVQMLAFAVGEPVPPEYGPMIAAELAAAGEPSASDRPGREQGTGRERSAVIIGAGASGLCAAVFLRRAGISYTIIEANVGVGGTWLENSYPGAGVDTPSHLYAFSFAPHDWPDYFSLRDDLVKYLEKLVDDYGLRPNIRFGTRVERATWDEAAGQWSLALHAADGRVDSLAADLVFSAVGIFRPPVVPQIPGLETFGGPCVHTAQWPPGLDIEGKHVALIGSGASAMQAGPAIVNDVASLTIFQRQPQWVAEFTQFRRAVPVELRRLLETVPAYRLWYRLRLAWIFNDRVYPSLRIDPAWAHPERSANAINERQRINLTSYITSELGDRADLIAAAVPTYPPFTKRMLMDNGWYRMLRRPHVRLITDPVSAVSPDGVIAATGEKTTADVLVLATGFDVTRFLNTLEVIGRSGVRLADEWEGDNARAYLGITVPKFPNFFMLYGPNVQPGHGGSVFFAIERQLNYIMDLLIEMADRDVSVVECRPDVFERYNDQLDKASAALLWTRDGVSTYYRNQRGRVVVNLPYRNVDLWHLTGHADLGDYLCTKVS